VELYLHSLCTHSRRGQGHLTVFNFHFYLDSMHINKIIYLYMIRGTSYLYLYADTLSGL
jgi:hypothetical protein